MKKVMMLQYPNNTREGLEDLIWSPSRRDFVLIDEIDLSQDNSSHDEEDLAIARELHSQKHYLGHVELIEVD